jgi:dipeptidyl aminopeptidase/acylaminoacyl peptidase
MSPEASRLVPGARLGPYEIVALLDRGGMGEVYRARDVRLSRDVALKVLHADFAADAERVRRFEQEAKAAGALNHPNILAVYDTGESEGSPYIVTELLEGETLRERLGTGGLGVRRAVEYAAQVARGLAAAHERGIVHRDLKPENLFVTKDGLVKILDFGIAKLGRAGEEGLGTRAETLSNTSPGTVLGTMGYMSPEQARGLAAGHRSDVFSLGAVLFEMLTGRRAFKGATPADTLSAILREDPTEGILTASELPAGLLRVVRRCLEKAPEDRFQSARDLAFALEGVTGETREVKAPPGPAPRRRWLGWGLVGLGTVVAVAGLGLWKGRNLAPGAGAVPPSFQRLTFRLGSVQAARFAPDGETILYSAEWGSQPSEMFSTRTTSGGSRALGITDATLLAVSLREEMALLLRPHIVNWSVYQGTLARAPVAGGAPREVADDVIDADWSPDGRDLAVVQVLESGVQLQFPIGHVLYAPPAPHWISRLRVSPRGDRIAFFEHPVEGDIHGDLKVIDRQGRVTTVSAGYSSGNGLGWSADGQGIWLSASRTGGTPQEIRLVTLAGRERVVVELAGGLFLLDVSRTGDMLISRTTQWTEVRARGKGAADEAELPAASLSFLSDLSPDGGRVLGTDIGEASGPNYALYVQGTDGSAPVWLGEGDGQSLSPDGKSALALLRNSSPQQLSVVPTGAGESRVLPPGPVTRYERAVWDPTGRRVVFSGAEREGGSRLYVQDPDGGPPRAASPAGVRLLKVGRPVSPDGTRVVAAGPDGVPALYPLAGGDPTVVRGLTETDVPLCFTPDGRELFVARYEESPPRVERVEIASGRTRPWTGMRRTKPSGLEGDYTVLVTPDGASYAYSYLRFMSDLYLVTGRK